MIVTNPPFSQGGNAGHPPQGVVSLNSNIFMIGQTMALSTRARNYNAPKENPPKKYSTSTSQYSIPLSI